MVKIHALIAALIFFLTIPLTYAAKSNEGDKIDLADIASRLEALESVNAGSRLQALEDADADTRLNSLEASLNPSVEGFRYRVVGLSDLLLRDASASGGWLQQFQLQAATFEFQFGAGGNGLGPIDIDSCAAGALVDDIALVPITVPACQALANAFGAFNYVQVGNLVSITLSEGTVLDFVVSGDGKTIMTSKVNILNVGYDVMFGSIYVGARVGPLAP